MRNLAGRLTARSVPELIRIADFWQTVISGRDRHALVGQLYREMRESRSARDAWARLIPEERRIIQYLALDDDQIDVSRTIPDLATAIGLSDEQTRETAISLYRKGILYREGDDDELPIGQLPRVFLPKELTTTFRRVQDEIDAGPLQRVPLPALLALLDDADLEVAANFWGVGIITGLDSREAIAQQLVDALSDSERRSALLKTLKGDALELWKLLSAANEPGVPLDALMTAAGMSGEGNALAQRRRTAVGQLEERLLAWHTYGPGEERFLFIPAELKAESIPSVERRIANPLPVAGSVVTPEPWNHPWAVPWDLLTLVRLVTGTEAIEIRRFEDLPVSWSEQIAGRFWNGEREGDLSRYLSFLAALGRQENALAGGDGTGGPLTPDRAWKHWRSRTFADQFSHLIWWWNASPDWIEGLGAGFAVRNATPPQFRRKLLALLAGLESGAWYDLASVARWVASVDPDILGEDAAIATAGALAVPPGHANWSDYATAAVVEAELLAPFVWFGLVETGRDDHNRQTLRTTDMLGLVSSSDPIADLSPPAGPAIVVHPDLRIDLIDPSPLRVWSISAFADTRSLRPLASYQLSAESVRRALANGASLLDVTTYLEADSGKPLPAEVRQSLQTWSDADRRIVMRLIARITTDADRQAGQLGTALREAGWEVEQRDQALEVVLDLATAEKQITELQSLVRKLGFRETRKPPDHYPEVVNGSGDS